MKEGSLQLTDRPLGMLSLFSNLLKYNSCKKLVRETVDVLVQDRLFERYSKSGRKNKFTFGSQS